MTENNTSVEYNLDENHDSEGYTNEDVGDNESTVPDSSYVSSDHTDFGDELDDNGPNTVKDAAVTANTNIPKWTTNFTNITIEPFTQNSGHCLLESLDVSMATALDFFNLLFKLEIFSDIKDHTNNYSIFKQEDLQRNRNNPDYVDSVWQETKVEELKALFGIKFEWVFTHCHNINCTGTKMTSLAIVE